MVQVIITVDNDDQARQIVATLAEAEGDTLDFAFNTEIKEVQE